ncbi:uncharacterized protein HaLaN_02669 [Haematococcus lacustris]|uniref:DM2 domain-containing protein n=1 Tax=Haematococcus lacustris TaxID=44745 RepID=A0A699YNV8_HAELA|nr:uncharacterized protein HaLaN_02669 [Haematococcus lacustris]
MGSQTVEATECGTPVDTSSTPLPGDDQLKSALKELLDRADLQTTTEKKLRQELEEQRKASGGFAVACKLSPALAAFVGSETLSRAQVVKRIWDHIKANNLQDPKDKRKILPDKQLGTFLKAPVTMFSMNKQLSKHIHADDGGSAQKKKRAPSEDEGSEDGSAESEDDDEEASEDEATPKRKARAKAKPPAKKHKASSESGTPKTNGFNKPQQLSSELSQFFGGETVMSRPELTKRFWAYFKEHNLQDPSNKQPRVNQRADLPPSSCHPVARHAQACSG